MQNVLQALLQNIAVMFYDISSTQKTRRAWQSQTWGRPAPQVRVQNQFQEDEIPLAVMAGRMKKFSENTSTIPEVMDSSTLNFKANFKFSRFLGGWTPSPFGCVQ